MDMLDAIVSWIKMLRRDLPSHQVYTDLPPVYICATIRYDECTALIPEPVPSDDCRVWKRKLEVAIMEFLLIDRRYTKSQRHVLTMPEHLETTYTRHVRTSWLRVGGRNAIDHT